MCQRWCLLEGDRELTVEEIVTDPMVRDLMRVDHVEPDAFQELLRSLASRSLAHRTVSPSLRQKRMLRQFGKTPARNAARVCTRSSSGIKLSGEGA